MQGHESRKVEGPIADRQSGAETYIVHGEQREVRFAVFPDEAAEAPSWDVEIEGVPPPSIVHEEPWRSPQEARDAAIKAVNSILDLERMQWEDQHRSKPVEEVLAELEPDEDEPGAVGR